MRGASFVAGLVVVLSASPSWAATNPVVLPRDGGMGPVNPRCNGSTDATAYFQNVGPFAYLAPLANPSANFCPTTLAQSAFPNMANLYQSGLVKDVQGNLRGPFYSTISAVPAKNTPCVNNLPVGCYNTDQLHAFNADWSHVPIAIELNLLPTALGALSDMQPGVYQLGRQTSPIFIRSFDSAGQNLATDKADGRTGHGDILVNMTNTSPGGDHTAFWFEGLASGQKPGYTNFLANSAITGLGGQLKAAANGIFMEPVGDVNCVDGGFDAGCMNVFNLFRSNMTGAANANFVGLNVQSAAGKAVDSFLHVNGQGIMGVDLAHMGTLYTTLLGLPNVQNAGTGYVVGDTLRLDTTGGTGCDQTPTYQVLAVDGSGAIVPPLGVDRRGACKTWRSDTVSPIPLLGGTGTGATVIVTPAPPVSMSMHADTYIFGNSVCDASVYGGCFGSTTLPGASYFGYSSASNGWVFYVNNVPSMIIHNKDFISLGMEVTAAAVKRHVRDVLDPATTDTVDSTLAGGANSDHVIVWRSNAAANKTENIVACNSGSDGRTLVFKDGAGTAATYPILLRPVSGTIEGQASISISTNRGSYTIVCDGASTDWVTTN